MVDLYSEPVTPGLLAQVADDRRTLRSRLLSNDARCVKTNDVGDVIKTLERIRISSEYSVHCVEVDSNVSNK